MHKLAPLLNHEETHLLRILNHAITKEMYIWPKLKIYDRLKPNIDKDNKMFWEAYETIANHDISFVICNKSTFEPMLIIHPEDIAIKNKAAFDTVFSILGIPILYIDFSDYNEYKDEFEYESLHRKILNELKK